MRFRFRQSETGILAYGEIYTSLGQHGVCSATNEIVLVFAIVPFMGGILIMWHV
jgi:hypothetical protein